MWDNRKVLPPPLLSLFMMSLPSCQFEKGNSCCRKVTNFSVNILAVLVLIVNSYYVSFYSINCHISSSSIDDNCTVLAYDEK